MRNLKQTKLLSIILLIGAFVVGSSARAQSPEDKSQSPSPVKTNALSLISELEKQVVCPADGSETLCLAQHYQAKTEAAIAGLKALVRVDEQREGIVADMQRRIDIRGGIIDDLKKVDVNSQRVDTLGQDSRRLFEEQHRDDKETIGDLQQALDSCRSNQKWVFGAGVLTGGFVGYKIRGAGTLQSPFTSSASGFQFAQFAPPDFSQFQTSAEQRARQALKTTRGY